MKQYEQVIEVMRKNGGYATLGFLYQNVDVSNWATKTPYASIRRIVQDGRFFFKIKPGLWALNESKAEILNKFKLEKSPSRNADFNHSYYQGLLLEIGNLKGFKTYIPPQDKNKKFLNTKLGDIAAYDRILNFSYPEIVRRAGTVDVIWFNSRKLPHSFFEVEHSTDIQNSLLKFTDLQDFNAGFYIVAANERKKEFEAKIGYSAFKDIKERVKFLDYESVSKIHSNSFAQAKYGSL
ncbi:hypothetical protein ACSSWA_05535 [Melioribacter sp. Ez-97]|uniref:hypothetical protein n=1 Tax=Melioribacter sp. Ez-97 TaxID=3423434 RepID=UPI003ED9D30B